MASSSLPHALSSKRGSSSSSSSSSSGGSNGVLHAVRVQLQRVGLILQTLARHPTGRILLALILVLLMVIAYAIHQFGAVGGGGSGRGGGSWMTGYGDADDEDSAPYSIGRLSTQPEDEEGARAHVSSEAEHRTHGHRRSRPPSRHQRPINLASIDDADDDESSNNADSNANANANANANDDNGDDANDGERAQRPSKARPHTILRRRRRHYRDDDEREPARFPRRPPGGAQVSPPEKSEDEPSFVPSRPRPPAPPPPGPPALEPVVVPSEQKDANGDKPSSMLDRLGSRLRGDGDNDNNVAAPSTDSDNGNDNDNDSDAVFAAALPADLNEIPVAPSGQTCQAFLADRDTVPYKRDFKTHPVRVGGSMENTLEHCDVPCVHTGGSADVDAKFHGSSGGSSPTGPFSIMRNMESVTNYPSLDTIAAHSSGVDIVMTTHLDSDVPAGYFSWVEYRIMRELTEKNWNRAPTVAFISNCGAHSFRLRCIEEFQSLGVAVDSYGACLRNANTGDTKMQTIRSYPFTLAFENSQEMDYTTEKYFQALEAGSVPVVIGSLNADDYAPAPNSHLVVRTPDDIPMIAERIKYLISNRTAYDEMLAWKHTGPHEPFLALVDMAVVHSDCRICVWTATELRRREFKTMYPDATPLPAPTLAATAHSTPMHATKDRPCRCRDSAAVVAGASPASQLFYHVYVRERGRFEFQSIFLRHDQLTVDGLESSIIEAFAAISLRPLWTRERSSFHRVKEDSDNPRDWYRLYRVYPAHDTTQRKALYENTAQLLNSDNEVATWVQAHPCGELEVVLV